MSKGDKLIDGNTFYATPKNSDKSPAYPVFDEYRGGHYDCLVTGSTNGKYTAEFERKLYFALQSAIPLKVPKHWKKSLVLNLGINNGYVGVVNCQGKPYPTKCTLVGRGIQYEPVEFLVNNPAINEINGLTRKYVIGKKCALLRFTPDYNGLHDIIKSHAERMSKCLTTVNMNLVASRFSYAICSTTEASARTINKMIHDVYLEQPFIVYDEALHDIRNEANTANKGQPWQNLFNDVGGNFIAPEAHELLQKMWLGALRDLGIPTPYEKAEHTISSENNQLANVAGSILDSCIDALEESIEEVKAVFPGIELSINREELKYHVQPEGNGETESNRVSKSGSTN